MVIGNFPVVLTIAIELPKHETLLYTNKQQVAAGQSCHSVSQSYKRSTML